MSAGVNFALIGMPGDASANALNHAVSGLISGFLAGFIGILAHHRKVTAQRRVAYPESAAAPTPSATAPALAPAPAPER